MKKLFLVGCLSLFSLSTMADTEAITCTISGDVEVEGGTVHISVTKESCLEAAREFKAAAKELQQ